MSETAKHRHEFLPWLPFRNLLDIGYGGDPIVPWAVCCDRPVGSYTNVGDAPQHLGFHCRDIPFKDGTLEGIYSSHLLEDFTYSAQVSILREWLAALRSGGVIALLGPDQRRFEAHCARTGQGLNAAHKEPDYGLATFRSRVWGVFEHCGEVRTVEARDLADYSWMLVGRKA